MKFLPRTLLARTFFLTAALVLLSTTALLVLFRLSQAEPRANETAQLTASAVNLVRAALLASSPEKRPEFFAELGSREGIRLLPAERDDQLEALPPSRFFTLLKEKIAAKLGPKTRIALAVNGVPGFWVSFRLDDLDEEEYWVILSRERTEFVQPWQWMAWAALALALSLIFAWFIASRLSRPMAALANAAGVVGRGQTPAPLPEDGVTELRQLATAFNSMATDLARHERDRAEVLAGISHDLRTPLTRLRLEAELSIVDETAREAVVADIEQMETVIAQFLDYARGENGEAEEKVDIGRLLEEIVTRQNRPGRSLIGEITELPACRLRPKALLRAISNLVENAFKYGSPEVTLRANQDGERIVVEVMDRGPGIPEADLERVKRPFIRLDEARGNATGTGLGLAIVERIAKLHGGSFDLLVREGGGLIARLSLPISQ